MAQQARVHRRMTRRGLLRSSALAGVGLAALGAWSGCQLLPAQKPPTASAAEILYVTNHGIGDVPRIRQVVSMFEEKYPNIKVKHTDVTANYSDALTTWAAGQQLPDVFYTRANITAMMASRSWIEPLDDRLKQDAKELDWPEDYWPQQMAELKWNNKTWAVPYDYSQYAIWYNTELFDAEGVPYPKPDWTWKDVLDTAAKLTKKDASGKITQHGFMGNNIGWWWQTGLFLAEGGKLFTDDYSKVVVAGPENERMLQMLQDMSFTHKISPVLADIPQGVNPFLSKQAAMALGGAWNTPFYRESAKFKFNLNYMPIHPATGKRGVASTGGSWVMSAGSKQKDAAWAFAKFIIGKIPNEIWQAIPLRSLPARRAALPRWLENATLGDLPPKDIGIIPEQMKGAFPVRTVTYAEEFIQIQAQLLGELWSNKRPAKDVLEQWQTRANEMIQKNYKPPYV